MHADLVLYFRRQLASHDSSIKRGVTGLAINLRARILEALATSYLGPANLGIILQPAAFYLQSNTEQRFLEIATPLKGTLRRLYASILGQLSVAKVGDVWFPGFQTSSGLMI